MNQTTIRFIGVGLAVFSAWAGWAQPTNPLGATAEELKDATAEVVKRQAAYIQMTNTLNEARAAFSRKDAKSVDAAAKLFDKAIETGKLAGPTLPMVEMGEARAGVVATRTILAKLAQGRDDYAEAEFQIKRMLAVDPNNPEVRALKAANDVKYDAMRPFLPTMDISQLSAETFTNRTKAAGLVQDGRFLYECGRLEEAEAKLNMARRLDTENRAATYYSELVTGKKYAQLARNREVWAKKMLMQVEEAWAEEATRNLHVASTNQIEWPNPYATNTLVFTSSERQKLFEKMRRIKIDKLFADKLPLSEVVKSLADEVRTQDINFLISPNADPPASAGPQVEPQTGMVLPGAEAPELGATLIDIKPVQNKLTLEQALDVIVRCAQSPIKYSVEDYTIMFTPKANTPPPLYLRTFQISANTFHMGLAGVGTYTFGNVGSGGGGGYGGGGYGGGGYGGGSYGGGSYGGGGYGRGGGYGGGYGGGGYGGGGYGGGGYGGGGYGGGSYGGGGYGGGSYGGGGYGGGGSQGMQGQYIQASLVPQQQQGGGAGGRGGAAGGGGTTNRMQQAGVFLTQATPTDIIHAEARDFFASVGVALDAPKAAFWNDRLGLLLVKATLEDLDTIEKMVQVLNQSPRQITIKTKFLEVAQNDNKALGFDWYVGNWLVKNNSIGMQPGTAPTYVSPLQPTLPNPSGVFPGPGIVPGIPGPNAVPPATSDNQLTSGLRNSGSALATVTGILTDPQFRFVIRAIEQRDGYDLMNAPEVTTLNGRQTQVKVLDIRYVVTDMTITQTGGGYGGYGGNNGGNGGGGIVSGVGSVIQPIAEPVEVGPTLDVVPYIGADGYTVEMALIPTTKEFVGYDSPGDFVAQVQSVGANAAAPLVAPTPLPKFRLRQIATSVVVWDGQTVVLGGLLSEDIEKTKDKVPVLGDLPLVGRFFRSESKNAKKKNLLLFVTPRIIDPAGNPIHGDEDMPFARGAYPNQRSAPTPTTTP